MTRIALITSRFPYGPKEAFLCEEIAEISRTCDIVVIPALPTREPSVAAGVRSHRLRLLSATVLSAALVEFIRSPRRACSALASVVRAPRSLQCKIKNVFVFPTALAASRVVRRLGITHVHAYWLAIPATVAYVAASLNDLGWSATGHRYDLVGFNISDDPKRETFLKNAQFIRTISKAGERRVRASLGDAVHPRILTEHLGVRLPEQPAPISDPTTLRLICAANLERVKGHTVLLEAIADAQARGINVRCTLAGDGSLRPALEAQVRTLRIEECVEFTGSVPHEALLDALTTGTYDVAILTSIDEGPQECEGIPIFLAESMAAGLPVVATRSGAIVELVDEANGILCPTNDPRAIADAISALAADVQLRRRLGDAGRATISRRFNVGENAHRVAALLAAQTQHIDTKGIA